MTGAQRETDRERSQEDSGASGATEQDRGAPRDEAEQPEQPQTADELRAEIAQAREDLGDTVGALAERADVKARAKATIDQGKEQARQKGDEVKEKLGLGGDGGVDTDRLSQTAREAATTIKATVERNPLPFAVGTLVAVVLVIYRTRRS